MIAGMIFSFSRVDVQGRVRNKARFIAWQIDRNVRRNQISPFSIAIAVAC